MLQLVLIHGWSETQGFSQMFGCRKQGAQVRIGGKFTFADLKSGWQAIDQRADMLDRAFHRTPQNALIVIDET